MNELWVILLIVAFGFLSLELGVPTAILEIIAGVIGGNLLGEASLPWMDFIANYGILGLMFLAGLEIDRDELRRNLGRSFVLASSAYLIPLLTIFGLALLMTWSLEKSLITAIALSTTSLALLYPILRERGLLNMEVGHVILSAAMLVDLFSMISLALAFASFTYLSLLFLAILLVFMWHAPRIGRWLFARYRRNLAEMELRFLLLVLLALLFFAERILVSEAVLAFMMGLLFSEILEEHETLVEKLKGIIFAFFSPIFFFKAGSYLKLSSMSMMSLAYLAALLPSAYLSKYYGAKLASRRLFKIYRMREEIARFAGLSFNLRLTFGIVSAVFGLELGIIGLDLYMAIVTAIIASALISTIIGRLRGY